MLLCARLDGSWITGSGRKHFGSFLSLTKGTLEKIYKCFETEKGRHIIKSGFRAAGVTGLCKTLEAE